MSGGVVWFTLGGDWVWSTLFALDSSHYLQIVQHTIELVDLVSRRVGWAQCYAVVDCSSLPACLPACLVLFG